MAARFAEIVDCGLCGRCRKWSRFAAWVRVHDQALKAWGVPELLCAGCREAEVSVAALTEDEIEVALAAKGRQPTGKPTQTLNPCDLNFANVAADVLPIRKSGFGGGAGGIVNALSSLSR